jgi:hypothetical protein
MKKRGQITLKAMVELIVAIVIFTLFIYVGRTWGNGEVFQKARAAKEISLIIDAMYATEGNAYITYPVNLSKFIIKFSSDKIEVSSAKRQPDPTAVSYQFIAAKDLNLDKELNKPNKLVLAKLGSEILILDNEPNLNTAEFEKISTKGAISDLKILLDIDEETLNNPKKFEKAKDLIESIKPQFKNTYLTPKTLTKGIQGTSTDDADILISIKIGEYTDQRNTIKSYYAIGTKERKKLASIIINKLLEKDLNLDGANAIPTDSLSILTNAKLAVLLEIGNINSEKSITMLNTKTADIADAIYNAIKEYYYS